MRIHQTLIVVAFLLLLPSISASNEQQGFDLVASSPLSQQLDSDVVLCEKFLPQQGPYPYSESTDMVQLSWWSWSDETNSNWPDDDAHARFGELSLQNGTTALYNEEAVQNQDIAEGILLGRQHATTQTALTLDGSVEIASDENGQWFVRIPVEMSTLVNLSNNTILYIFLSEDIATDQHQRTAHHLIRDMQPEIRFSNQAGNKTNTTWVLSSEHLTAAGIDLQENPYGWHITLAFFGEVEGDSTNRLLALYHQPLPNRWHSSTTGDFALPLFLLVLSAVLASSAVLNAMKREKGMPKLNASWKTIHPPVAHFSFEAGSLPVHLKSCETELPWGIKGGFKAKRIPSNTTHEFILRFRELQPCDCQVSLALEVEELGSWTQYLRLVNPEIISENEKRSVEINNLQGEIGEHDES